ncbi:hypothetical protein GCM10008019_35750 [Deinococcus soli (ex Cha et al. 2016)]|nr:hypothetical protein GCM10008019_35750 [Deinococcus soli (ex Cha et al. 2016)]
MPSGAARLWAHFHALPKVPLLVQVQTVSPVQRGLPLDELLAVAVQRAHRPYWPSDAARTAPSVAPLPLALLDTVTFPVLGEDEPACLPLWATTPLILEDTNQLDALCLGHQDELRTLLRHITFIGRTRVRAWSVRRVLLSVPYALEVIQAERRLPIARGADWGGFTPPYRHARWHRPLTSG